ncbi:MAG: hypothetical protein ACWA5U_04760 [bacterium]
MVLPIKTMINEKQMHTNPQQVSHDACEQALKRAQQYLSLCAISEQDRLMILQAVKHRLSHLTNNILDIDDIVALGIREMLQQLPTDFNAVREQRCKPNANLDLPAATYPLGSLRAKTGPKMQRSSIRAASLEKLSFKLNLR